MALLRRTLLSRCRMSTGLTVQVILVAVTSFLQLTPVFCQTNPVSVAGLLDFKSQVQDPSSVLASWQTDTPPCNTSNCNFGATLPDCNWAGIACENWQIVALTVPCTPQPSGNPGTYALQTKIGGSPLNALTRITSLRAIDLDGNALAGTLPDAYAGNLSQLVVLLLGSNHLTGALPASWSNLDNMAVVDFGNNNLAGGLPESWGRWTSIRGLRVTGNFLKGPLPSAWGQWSIIEQLQLGDNMFTGTVPSSWSDMLRLQDLELQYNCGLCGALPPFSLQATGQLTIDTAHSSLGKECGRSNCSSTDSNTVLKAVLGTAAACFVLGILLLRQWQVRRWNALGYDTSATIEMRIVNRLRRCCGLAPIAAPRRSSSSHRQPTSATVRAPTSHTRRPRRPKQPQPTLVIMPDGQGLCFAVRLPDGNAAKEDLPQQSESAQHAISSGQDLGTSDMPQQQQPMHFTEDSEQQQHDLANGHSAHTPAAHPGSDSALRPAGHAVYVSRSQNAAPVDVELGTTAMHET